MFKRTLLIAFLLLTSNSIISQTTTAQQDFNSGNFSKCIEKCNALLKNDSENSQANFLKGASLVRLKDYKSAETYLNKALSLKYQPAIFVQTNKLRVKAGLKETESVLASLEKLVSNGFGFSPLFNNEEFTYLKNNENFIALKLKVDENANPCKYKTQYKRLDFWLGQWNVYVNGNKTATSSITKSEGECTLYEDYKTQTGFLGRSMNYYDAADSLYTQIWIDKLNNKTVFKEIASKAGYLQMEVVPKGATLTRMSYTLDKEKEEVSQLMESSTDEGKTWNQTFLGVYKKKDIKNEIISTIDVLDKALVARDYKILNTYYSENLKLVAPNGFIVTKKMVLSPFKDANKKSALKSVTNEDLQISVNGNTAYVVMKTIHKFNDSADRVYKNINIFVKENNVWKLELISSTLL